MEKHQIWKTALSRLQERIDSPVFTTWISNTVALSFHKGIFVVGVVQRFTVVDNSNFSPNHLTVHLAFLMLASCGVLPSPHIK